MDQESSKSASTDDPVGLVVSEEKVTLYGQDIKRPTGLRADHFTNFWKFFYKVLQKRPRHAADVQEELDRQAMEPMELFRKMVERG